MSVTLPKLNLGVELKTSTPIQDTQSPRKTEIRALQDRPTGQINRKHNAHKDQREIFRGTKSETKIRKWLRH